MKKLYEEVFQLIPKDVGVNIHQKKLGEIGGGESAFLRGQRSLTFAKMTTNCISGI